MKMSSKYFQPLFGLTILAPQKLLNDIGNLKNNENTYFITDQISRNSNIIHFT